MPQTARCHGRDDRHARRRGVAPGTEESVALSTVAEGGAGLPHRGRLAARRRRPRDRIELGPSWLVPPLVLVTSPNGIRDVLGREDALAERCMVHDEVRNLAGDSLFVLPYEPWRPRKRALQPVFTSQNVRSFGGHMSRAAQAAVTVGAAVATSTWTPSAAG